MAEDHEFEPVSPNFKEYKDVSGDRLSQHKFFEGRHIDHHMGEGAETPGPVRRLINRFYELRGKRTETRQLPTNETAQRFADKMNSGSTTDETPKPSEE